MFRMRIWNLSFLLALGALINFCQAELEGITDEDLKKLVVNEKYVVVLFCGKSSEACEDYESELSAIREDLVDSLNAWVVKASDDSPLKADFNPGDKPTIVFLRNRVPVLYTGPANEEIMLETLAAYKETCTQALTDTSFEHLTQAASGATTGDWLVSFFKDECDECQRMIARLETVACANRGRINVARVNKGSTGAVTGRRFAVAEVPALIYFRLGKMYRYNLEKYDVDSLNSFVGGFYKNLPGEPVPVPKTPFDDLVQMCVDYIRDYPLMCAVCVGVPLLLLLAFYFLMSGEDEYKKSKSKKKSKKKEAKKD